MTQKTTTMQKMTTIDVDRALRIGLVSISDRASTGVYQDQGLPALQAWFGTALSTPWVMETRLIPDERTAIEQALIDLVDHAHCDLVITTGGTGPARRDVTPEATLAVATKEMPGFGEQMRQISLQFVPTAILSRQVAVVRESNDHAALILNLPGQPKSIKETLEGLKDADGKQIVAGIFAAIPYCIDLIGGPYVETHESVCKVFRPKSALRVKTSEV
jgi:molybdopterin adenylyltransferase